MELPNWMEQLHPTLKNTSICYLSIPGSHDSLSFSVNRSSSLSPDAPALAQFLNKICGPLMKKIIYNWCVTQTANLTQQFMLGVRYFDLRVATKRSKIYSCHALYGMNIIKALHVLNEMLQKYTKEIIILDFQCFYNFQNSHHFFLSHKIHSIFGKKLCPLFEDVSCLTVERLQMNKFQVIVIYRNDWRVNVPEFWPNSKWITLWPNTTDITQLCKYLTETLKKRKADAGFVSQCVFTPSPKFIARHVFSTLKNSCGLQCDMKIKSIWIKNQKCLIPNGVNVIIADFIDIKEFDFCSLVVKLNEKSLSSKNL